MAADNGHQSVVQLLLGRGSDLHMSDNMGETPLHTAVRQYKYAKDAIKIFLDREADTNKQENERKGHRHVVKILLKSGADPSMVDRSGETPLSYALKHSLTEIVNILVGGSRTSSTGLG